MSEPQLTSRTPNWMTCAVCGYSLDRIGDDWIHVRDILTDAVDHPPVPVADGEVPARYRCDVCDAEQVTHEVDVEDFELPYGMSTSKGGWALCSDCAAAVRSRSVSRLRKRGELGYAAAGGTVDPFVRRTIRESYERLFIHLNGEVREVLRS